MPNPPGGYQPDTKSESSRRADFDLLRRIAALERQVERLDVANPNNALGIVAIGTGKGGPVAVTPPAEIVNPLSFKPSIGRRYRIAVTIRAVNGSGAGTYNTQLVVDGVGDASSERWSHFTVSYGAPHTLEWHIIGDGVQHTYSARIASGPITQAWTDDQSTSRVFYIEDVGSSVTP